MIHKKFILFSLIILSTLASAAPAVLLNKTNMRNYVHHFINGIYGAQLHQPDELRQLANSLARKIEKNPTSTRWNRFSREYEPLYSSEEVQEFAKSGVVEHIADLARHVAHEYTRDSETVERISEELTNEAIRIFTDYTSACFKYCIADFGGKFVRDINNQLRLI